MGHGAEAFDDLPGVSIHRAALVESRDIGAGTRVWAFAHINEGATVGRDCNICDHTFIEAGAHLGDRCTVKCGIYLWSGVTCEDDVFLGPNVVFTNDVFPRSGARPESFVPTRVAQGASIGANATIRAGIRVGRFAMIGLGAVVTRDVADFALVYGNPARQHGWVGRSGRPLSIDGDVGRCAASGEVYDLEGGRCRLRG
jgi:acetyltransferase-like isoleucine patch superfamily enzyme